MSRQKCSHVPCYAGNNGHIPICEQRPDSVKGLLDGLWETYENTFQLGFIFTWLCQLEIILQIVPSTARNASQKGCVAYLLLLTMWMWESRGFEGVHEGHFASILLWQVFSLFESMCTAHRHTLLSIGNVFLESGMVSYPMRGKMICVGIWEIHIV